MLVARVVAGAVAALARRWLHPLAVRRAGLETRTFTRYVAPVTEETLKAALRRSTRCGARQIGFLVDAAIVGFAIGAGLRGRREHRIPAAMLEDRRIWVWIVARIRHRDPARHDDRDHRDRGEVADRIARPDRRGWLILPGWLAAIVLHSAYNHALVSPLLAAGAADARDAARSCCPCSTAASARRASGSATVSISTWSCCSSSRSSHFGAHPARPLSEELRARFPGPVVADMFCLLQLDLELSIRAKGMLMAREAGLRVAAGSDARRASWTERAYLTKTIGRTGLLALRPLQVTSDRDHWHRYLLHQAGEKRRWKRLIRKRW